MLDAYALGIRPDTSKRWADAASRDGRFCITPDGLLAADLKRPTCS